MGWLEKLFPPMSREKFARRMIREMSRAPGVGIATYNPDEFMLVFAPSQHRVFLHNAYNDYLVASLKERGNVIRGYAGVVYTMSSESAKQLSYTDAKPSLLPRVRERYYHESIRLVSLRDSGKETHSFPTRDFADGLTVELVRDLPDSVAILGDKTLADWNVSFEDALVVAKENLWKLSNQEFTRHPSGLYLSPWRDTHDASRIFLHDLIWQLKVNGDHVAMIPNRNYLLVAGSDDTDALLVMIEIVELSLKENRPMTGTAYRLAGSQWIPFLPPVSSPAYLPMRMAATRSLVADHSEQKAMLEAICEKTGRDVFIASLMVIQRDDGSVWSWTSWVDGITDALMPKADYVCFGQSDGEGKSATVGWGKWEDVVRVASNLLGTTEHYPARYHVVAFPKPEQLMEMKLLASV